MAEDKTPKTQPYVREKDGTIKLTVSIPHQRVKTVTEELKEETVTHANVPGFRKGKAPKTLVENTIDTEKLREEVLKKLLPEAYVKAVEEHKLRPVMSPKIHVTKVEDGQDWEFTAETCEMPDVTVGKYKDDVQKITAKSKIEIPGKEKQEPSMDEILKVIMANTKATIPHIMVQQEADRLLSQTLDEIKRLGLTLDQYLQSTGKKPEELRTDYEMKAINDMTLEFAPSKIAEDEKIQVEPKEIEEAILKAKDPIEREQMEKNKYLLASILRQQKTLDFLKNL